MVSKMMKFDRKKWDKETISYFEQEKANHFSLALIAEAKSLQILVDNERRSDGRFDTLGRETLKGKLQSIRSVIDFQIAGIDEYDDALDRETNRSLSL